VTKLTVRVKPINHNVPGHRGSADEICYTNWQESSRVPASKDGRTLESMYGLAALPDYAEVWVVFAKFLMFSRDGVNARTERPVLMN
jgi:hypothetical protein